MRSSVTSDWGVEACACVDGEAGVGSVRSGEAPVEGLRESDVESEVDAEFRSAGNAKNLNKLKQHKKSAKESSWPVP